MKRPAAVATFLLVCLVAAGVVGLASPVEAASENRMTPVVRAVRDIAPSVVNIATEQDAATGGPFSGLRDPMWDKFFKDYFERYRPNDRPETSLGSGLIIDSTGYILTNEHVILRASRVKVTLQDGRTFNARVVGSEPARDLAVLKIDADKPFPTARLGDSADIMIGETVVAIGNPFGLSNTVTTGVISASERTIRTDSGRVYVDFLQTDASINPGNSGGPLLNLDGEVIGITTAVYGQAQGIGFAIPINSARRIVDDLIQYGKVHYGWFGIRIKDIPPRVRQSLGYNGPGRIYVSMVFPDSPAAKAGVQEGDLIESVGTHKSPAADAYRSIILGYTVGTPVDFVISRNNETRTITVTPTGFPKSMVDPYAWTLLGLDVKPASASEAKSLRLPGGKGLMIRRVKQGSAAEKIGIRPGDALLAIDSRELRDEDDFASAVAALRLKSSSVVLVQRGPYAYYISLELP